MGCCQNMQYQYQQVQKDDTDKHPDKIVLQGRVKLGVIDRFLMGMVLLLIFCGAYRAYHLQEMKTTRARQQRQHQKLAIEVLLYSMRNGDNFMTSCDQQTFTDALRTFQQKTTDTPIQQTAGSEKTVSPPQNNKNNKTPESQHPTSDQPVPPPQATGLINDQTFRSPISADLTVVAGISLKRAQFAQQLRTLRNQPFGQESELAKEQYEYYEKTRQISQYPELPICVVVPTFNNEPSGRYKANLQSILQQNYSNYHVVVINDASTDQTGPLLDLYLDELAIRQPILYSRVKVIHNSIQVRAMSNIKRAAMEYCRGEQIFMIVDGDDELLGRQVFKLFNSVFQKEGSWFVYSNFISFVGTIGYSRSYSKEVKQRNSYRKASFVSSHLRAFYTQLLRRVKDEDLRDEKGEYFHAANDVAICIPVMEMSHEKVTYIPEVTYWYNSNTGLNNHRQRLDQQNNNANLVRKKTPYPPLEQLFAQGQ